MMCVVGFYSVFFATAAVYAFQVSELHASVHQRVLAASAKAPLNVPGAFGNGTENGENADKNGVPLQGKKKQSSASASLHKDNSASNMSAQIEYTISTPRSSFLYLVMKHTADDYKYFQLQVYKVHKGWRPTPEQNHFLWYVIGPDEDGDVRIMNVKFKVLLTVKRKVRLLTTTTWVGACSDSDAQCPAQWLLYGVSNPDPEEADCLFVFHQSQNFMHHDSPDVTDAPYRTNLWRFDPPVPDNIIQRKLKALEW